MYGNKKSAVFRSFPSIIRFSCRKTILNFNEHKKKKLAKLAQALLSYLLTNTFCDLFLLKISTPYSVLSVSNHIQSYIFIFSTIFVMLYNLLISLSKPISTFRVFEFLAALKYNYLYSIFFIFVFWIMVYSFVLDLICILYYSNVNWAIISYNNKFLLENG